MTKPPGFGDYIFILAFFVIGNGGVLLAARSMARRATGIAQPLYFITALPLLWFFTYSSWQWLSDMTANNLWPIALVMLAVPTGIVWGIINWVQRRQRDR